MDEQVILILIDNFLAGVAAFLAIVVWVKTRDISWVFIILSVIGFYVSIIYKTLLLFGIVVSHSFAGINIGEMIFNYIPILLMITALTLKAHKNMKR
ncbi:MAG: hypothetical protein FWF38_04450 [Spirochaetaceae bacterium]|nr:hypothetical protein [Spirochaetaceae bacterium]